MRYDREGFPIPPEFELPDATAAAEALPVSDSETVQPRRRTGRAGWRKRLVVLAVLLGVVVPGLLGPQLLPTISAAVVNWSLEQAYACQATDDVAGAVNHLSRAISWHAGTCAARES